MGLLWLLSGSKISPFNLGAWMLLPGSRRVPEHALAVLAANCTAFPASLLLKPLLLGECALAATHHCWKAGNGSAKSDQAVDCGSHAPNRALKLAALALAVPL